MHLIAPEILAEDLSGLSIGLSAVGLLLGLALWLFGWRWYRFWVVLGITVLGGVYGLSEAAVFRAQPLVAGVLLALAAGVLALSLARVAAFAAGGCAAMLAVQALVPSWDQPLLSFVTGGLLGVLLFRVWVMALTSLLGVLLMTYMSLCLAEHLAKMNAGEFAAKRPVLLNWICGGTTALGFLLQALLTRRKAGTNAPANDREKDRPKPAEAKPPKLDKVEVVAPPRGRWWRWLLGPLRKAG
ncbi:MAG TPA: hypothetical protein VEL76_01320 [Gemmataceae bacterium]|nr:hypothetical protein [Gemmataceae bacterium]